MRFLLFALMLSAVTIAQEGRPTPKPITEVLVLRRQSLILDLQNKILAAQLAQEQIGSKLAQIDKETGCAPDWQAVPPVCKSQGETP